MAIVGLFLVIEIWLFGGLWVDGTLLIKCSELSNARSIVYSDGKSRSGCVCWCNWTFLGLL